MFRTGIGWEYVGVIHEYANCSGKENATLDKLAGDYHIEARTMGNRTQAFGDDQCAKYTKDAEILIDCLTNPESEHYEPDNQRYTFTRHSLGLMQENTKRHLNGIPSEQSKVVGRKSNGTQSIGLQSASVY